MIQNPADGSCADRAHGSGSARRRRERRLRSFLRHERMTVRMELAAAMHHSSFRGAGPETYDAPRSQSRTGSLPCPVRMHGYSGASWNRSSTQSLWCLFSTILCRRRWNSCQTFSGSSTGLGLFPSRLSQCPRSTPRTSLCARFCVLRSW